MMDALVPGTVVASKYTVLGVLGRGGMAVVYEVMNHQLGTPCALKVLAISARSVKERLVREGRVQSQLAHPNILSVFDVIDVEGAPGLLMELVRGPSLERLITETRLTFVQCDALADGIFDGMEAAHKGGLIHRDLKPANILCSVAGGRLVPKIGDFGLAKVVSEESGAASTTTRSGTTMGTPAYMAPEQIRNAGKVDQRADIFSLGAILYEMVCGQKAFGGDDLLELYTSVAAGRFKPPREHVPDLPERMERAILGALEPDKEKRIRDCATLALVWSGEREEWTTEIPRSTLSGGPWDAGFLARYSVPSTSGDRLTSTPARVTPEQSATWLGDDEGSHEADVAVAPATTSQVTLSSGINASSVSVVAGGFLFLVGALALAAVGAAAVGAFVIFKMQEPDTVVVEVPVPTPVAADPVPVPVPVPDPVVAAPVPAPTAAPTPPPRPVLPTPAPAPDPAPVVAVAPEPTPAPAPAPVEPDIPAGLVRIDLGGDVQRVFLRSADGNFALPANLVPGTYELIVFFEGSEPVSQGQQTVRVGGDKTITCSSKLRKCR